MPHTQYAYKAKSRGFYIQNILRAFFIFILIFAFAQNAFCAQSHIEKKRKETHAKVVRLKRLESIERSRKKSERNNAGLSGYRISITQQNPPDIQKAKKRHVPAFTGRY